MPQRQTVTLTMTTTDDTVPEEFLAGLRASLSVVSLVVDDVSDIEEVSRVNRERLIGLAVWAAGEDAKRQLGLRSEWRQASWLTRDRALSCGTACCMAGKVAFDDGGLPAHWDQVYDGYEAGTVTLPNGRHVGSSAYAEEVLGLSGEQAYALFAGGNDLDRVLDVIGEILSETKA